MSPAVLKNKCSSLEFLVSFLLVFARVSVFAEPVRAVSFAQIFLFESQLPRIRQNPSKVLNVDDLQVVFIPKRAPVS